jgi:hypothetical protein
MSQLNFEFFRGLTARGYATLCVAFILLFYYIDLLFNTLKTSFYELFLILRELISKYRQQR